MNTKFRTSAFRCLFLMVTFALALTVRAQVVSNNPPGLSLIAPTNGASFAISTAEAAVFGRGLYRHDQMLTGGPLSCKSLKYKIYANS